MDKYDIPFLFKNINDEMPIFTDDVVKVKASYSQGMPKNIKEYGTKINEKFLDDNLGMIEDTHLKFKTSIFSWFKKYQNKYFGATIKDSFLKIDNFIKNDYKKHVLACGFLINSYTFGSHVNGADITIGGTSAHSASNNGYVIICGAGTGVIGEYYNQIAINMFTGAGNDRLALYSESAGVPDTLLVETSSSANTTGFNWKSMTEVALVTTNNWLGLQVDSASADNYIVGSGWTEKLKSFTYGSYPNPAGSGYTTGANIYHMKVGHT